jgi:hypothetical protein
LSSAILYVAIVAIWAGVLIPRWLRRDSPSGGQVSDETVTTEAPAEEEPPEPPRQREDPAPRARPKARPPVAVRVQDDPPRAEDDRAEDDRAEDDRRGAPRDREHARVLSARRRLLGLLVTLTIGSGALAGTRLAAWWVIIPPSVMLLGYLAVLREAAQADAERRERPRVRTTAVTRVPASVAPAAPPPPAPDAKIIDIGAVQPDEEFYDQYTDAKLRAVGDLTRV